MDCGENGLDGLEGGLGEEDWEGGLCVFLCDEAGLYGEFNEEGLYGVFRDDEGGLYVGFSDEGLYVGFCERGFCVFL